MPGRLWSFVIAWDTGYRMRVRGRGIRGFFDSKTGCDSLAANTAFDLGAALLDSQTASAASSSGGVVDVGTPAWWSGACDDTNFYNATGVHSFAMGAFWHGVPACGPRTSVTSRLVRFFSGAWGEYEFSMH